MITVILASVGNPDYNQDPDRSLPGVPSSRTKKVATLEEASITCLEYIRNYGLVGETGAYVSYNGRIWGEESEYIIKG